MPIRDGNPTKFLDPERIRIRNLDCGFGLFILTTFVEFKKRYLHSSLHVYFRLGKVRIKKWSLLGLEIGEKLL